MTKILLRAFEHLAGSSARLFLTFFESSCPPLKHAGIHWVVKYEFEIKCLLKSMQHKFSTIVHSMLFVICTKKIPC